MISARCPAKGRPSLRAGTSQRTMVLSSPHRACWLGRRIPLQRWPVVVQPFALDLPDLVLAHPEALGDSLAGLGHRHLVILGVYQFQENLLAALFGKVFSRTVFGHGLSPSAGRSFICEGPPIVLPVNVASGCGGERYPTCRRRPVTLAPPATERIWIQRRPQGGGALAKI